MSYALRYRGHAVALIEASPAALRRLLITDDPAVWYHYVTPECARTWVRDGGHHETPLYVDLYGGRGNAGTVRYARDDTARPKKKRSRPLPIT